jgi:hypothetical protein
VRSLKTGLNALLTPEEHDMAVRRMVQAGIVPLERRYWTAKGQLSTYLQADCLP